MANNIEELFPEVAVPAPAQQQAQPEPQPNEELAELRGQVGQLTNVIGQMINRPPIQQQQPQPGIDLDRLFQDSTFFTPDDSRLLLTSPDPDKHLNSMANKIKREVAAPLMNIIQNQGRALQQFTNFQQAEFQRLQYERSSEENVNKFYSASPELKNYEKIVRAEAMALSQEYQSNPSAFAGKSENAVFGMLADRVKGTLKQYGVDMGAIQGQAQQQTLSPATRRQGFMERGSGVRVAPPAAQNDPNRQELDAMSKRMTRQRTR